MVKSPAVWVFVVGLLLCWWVGRHVEPVWVVEQVYLEPKQEAGDTYFEYRGARYVERNFAKPEESELWCYRGHRLTEDPKTGFELVVDESGEKGPVYYAITADCHWRYWSLLPAALAVLLCFLTREPVTALVGGVIGGALLQQAYDIPGQVLLPGIGTATGATIVVLYLWFLGGLLGIWSKNGAAQAFADLMTRSFVRGPRSAKFVGWLLGVVFFQGGTMSAVLVGTTVRPVADAQRVSHEELSYIVDATASPVAVLLPFNVWPIYVQSFIFLPGIAALSTESARVGFFFDAIPLSFYAFFSVLFTLLLCFDKLPFMSRTFREAVKRSREQGLLDRPGSEPLLAKELEEAHVPDHYKPHVIEFFVPLALIIGITIATYIATGTPRVLWGFFAGLLSAFLITMIRGMSLKEAIDGFTDGLKGVVYGSVILLLAVVIGKIQQETGGGLYLVELLGERVPYWTLPAVLFLLSLIIAFSTGTSFGTFAVVLPLSMPLTWAIAQASGLNNPELFLTIGFAAVINGSVFGDQCSPISDTTILSSMSTGADLVDHVRTQLYPSVVAGVLSVIGWTLVAWVAC